MLTARGQPRKQRRLTARDRAALILAAVDDLPWPPPIPAGLLDAGDPAVVIDIFEHDVSRLSSLRRFARQTEYGAAAQVMSAREIVAHLGVETVRDAALALHYRDVLGSPGNRHGDGDPLAHLWRHSLSVACACRMLCERAPRLGDAATAFVCGLLHDIGKFALWKCCPRSYARVCQRAGEHDAFLVESERDTFGVDHAVVGGCVGMRLVLASPMVDGIRLHHRPFDETDDPARHALPALVHVADRMVNDEAGIASGDRPRLVAEEIADWLGVEAGVLASVASELSDRTRPFVALVSVPMNAPESHCGHLLRARPSAATRTDQESEPLIHTDHTVVRAIRHFCESVGSGAQAPPPRRVCEAAATCVCEALAADSCVAVLGSTTSDVLYLGVAAREYGASVSARSRVMPASAVTISEVVTAVQSENAFVKASQACDLIWEWCFNTVPRGPLWQLPLVFPEAERDSEMRSGVLVSMDDRHAARRSMDSPGWETLAMVMRLVAEGAIILGEPETTTGRVADETRHGHGTTRERSRDRLMSTVAVIAGGAAHELNNPLSVISGRVQLLLRDCEDESTATTLREIKDQAHSASEIVTDLMRFARPEPPRAETFALVDFLNPLFQRWQTSFQPDQAHFTFEAADRHATIHADAGQVAEILEAVVANAIAATRQGVVRVKINSPSRATDETVRIVVTDDGAGMARDVLAHAFDPFFSFRQAGRGRGMGLSRAYRLAEINGGRLRLESKIDAGTTVTIELPSRPAGA